MEIFVLRIKYLIDSGVYQDSRQDLIYFTCFNVQERKITLSFLEKKKREKGYITILPFLAALPSAFYSLASFTMVGVCVSGSGKTVKGERG